MSRRELKRRLADVEREIITFKRIMRAAHKPWTIEERGHCRALKNKAKAIRREIAERFGITGQVPAGEEAR